MGLARKIHSHILESEDMEVGQWSFCRICSDFDRILSLYLAFLYPRKIYFWRYHFLNNSTFSKSVFSFPSHFFSITILMSFQKNALYSSQKIHFSFKADGDFLVIFWSYILCFIERITFLSHSFCYLPPNKHLYYSSDLKYFTCDFEPHFSVFVFLPLHKNEYVLNRKQSNSTFQFFGSFNFVLSSYFSIFFTGYFVTFVQDAKIKQITEMLYVFIRVSFLNVFNRKLSVSKYCICEFVFQILVKVYHIMFHTITNYSILNQQILNRFKYP